MHKMQEKRDWEWRKSWERVEREERVSSEWNAKWIVSQTAHKDNGTAALITALNYTVLIVSAVLVFLNESKGCTTKTPWLQPLLLIALTEHWEHRSIQASDEEIRERYAIGRREREREKERESERERQKEVKDWLKFMLSNEI